mgnify:CR=1 FL=1
MYVLTMARVLPSPKAVPALNDGQKQNKNNVPIYSVRLEDAFPVTMQSIQLDSNSENTIQKLNVTLSYENYVPENIVDTAKSTISTIRAGIGI